MTLKIINKSDFRQERSILHKHMPEPVTKYFFLMQYIMPFSIFLL